MPDGSTVAVFAAAALALLVVPGPAVLYIVARGIEQGRAAALASALGVQAGSLVHVAAAALGLSAVLASSATAFAVVKYLGAAYLIFLGVRTLLSRRGNVEAVARAPRSLGRIFGQGMVVQVLNPKVALFFLAFIPQFVDPVLHLSNHRLVMRTKHLIDLSGLGEALVRIGAEPAGEEELLACHAPGHVARVRDLSAAGGGEAGDGGRSRGAD